MCRSTVFVRGAIAIAAAFSLGGCPNVQIFFPGLSDIRVEVVNDTAFRIAPDIRIDDDDGGFDALIAGLFGGDALAVGTLESGELIEFTFDCDSLGLIFAEESEQLALGAEIGESDDTDILRRGKEFDCGDRIRFRFIGSFDDFEVIVSVNGRVIDD